jgi:ABC-type polysaccharide/polyol phosphate transport system ATPase subunit
MTPILEIQNVSKRFVLGQKQLPYLSLRDKLATLFKATPPAEEFWALSDVTFHVEAGQSLGIIGRNGAGKSTLLKILSRITPPTKGKIICRGRIASLLEVGTGFHQELTGRENIYMNGSLLGMKNAEITRRFDEIVEFSGTEKFLDTALKHYSSGMQLRLAFAVAAHLDPEILIIDEVLAVGDAEFQKKCIQKMETVTHSGRTVLFVSHNLQSLRTICNKGILLKEGRLLLEGRMDDVIDRYVAQMQTAKGVLPSIDYFDDAFRISSIRLNGADSNELTMNAKGRLELVMNIAIRRRMSLDVLVHIKQNDALVASYGSFVDGSVTTFDVGDYRLQYHIDIPDLRSGKYQVDLFFEETLISYLGVAQNSIELQVINDHSIHLNNPTLKWGAVLMSGTMGKPEPL